MGIFDKFFKRKKDYADEIVAKLSCDCSILKVESVTEVMTKYKQALQQGKQKDFTPLLIIPSEMMVEIVDNEAAKDNPANNRETIIRKAMDIDVEELLNRMLSDVMPDEDEEEDEDIAGEFEIGEQVNQFLSLEEWINKKIVIAKIPTDKPWELAAWVPMGGFNECPLPEEQVAVFKYWFENYQAIPAVVTSDVWELYVEKPPVTQKEAESLAWGQFGFCGDIVYQGVGTVNALAGTLIHSSVWYFWWD